MLEMYKIHMLGILIVVLFRTSAAGPSVVVALAGGSGAGKSYIGTYVKKVFGHANVSILSHDRYYKDQAHLHPEERARLNFDHPDMLESSLMLEHIQGLQRGETVDVPVYDFQTHSRLGYQQITPAPLVLVDGILVLAETVLSQAFDIRIYVDTPADIRLLRRIKRDLVERGRSVESVLQQYQDTVRPMHELFVESSKARADVIVSGTEGERFEPLVTLLAARTGLVRSSFVKDEL
uniref:uridine/cytidine kinase n=1 Tax=Prorocentrum minimum TaxID=39449 RepID=A9P6Q2_PROMN|nr:uridine kinase [Prorocentrum minimum]